MSDLGRLLMVAGGVIFVAGLLLSFSGRLPWFGNLPRDLHVEREGFSLYAPIASMIVLSILLTVLLNVVIRLFR